MTLLWELCGISLLSIAGKSLARILLNRLIDYLEDGLLPKSVWVQTRAWHSGHDLCSTSTPKKVSRTEHRSFVDLTKAFDTVCRKGLGDYGQVRLSS